MSPDDPDNHDPVRKSRRSGPSVHVTERWRDDIRHAIIRRGLTVPKAAALVGMGRQNLAKLLDGRIPGSAYVPDLSNEFAVPLPHTQARPGYPEAMMVLDAPPELRDWVLLGRDLLALGGDNMRIAMAQARVLLTPRPGPPTRTG